MRTIKVKLFQSLLDISVQEYGTPEGIVAIALANDISITDELEAETELKIPEFNTNKKVLKYFAENNIIPATAQLSAEIEDISVIDDDLEFNLAAGLLINDNELLLVDDNILLIS